MVEHGPRDENTEARGPNQQELESLFKIMELLMRESEREREREMTLQRFMSGFLQQPPHKQNK